MKNVNIHSEGKQLTVTPTTDDLMRGNCRQFRKHVTEKIDGKNDRIKIDLSRAQKIDACGLNTLAVLKKRADEKNVKLSISNIKSNYTRNVLEIASMDELFQIENTEYSKPLKST